MVFDANLSILNTFKLKPKLKFRQDCHLVTREKSLILSDQSEKPITERQVYSKHIINGSKGQIISHNVEIFYFPGLN